MGLKSPSPTSKAYANDFSRFMFKLLSKNKIPPRSADQIARHGWRNSSNRRYATCTRRWLKYCQETKNNEFHLNLNSLLNFFHFGLDRLRLSFNALVQLKTFLSVCRRLSGNPFSNHEWEVITKFFSGLHNKNRKCKITANLTWDVKILLDYFEALPENSKLTMQELAGKLFLIFLVCSCCRISEVLQFQFSCIESPRDGDTVIFHLSHPTKTFTWKRLNQMSLQKLTFRRIPGYHKICPVVTLVDYMKMTAACRWGEDILFVLTTGKPASRITVCRWARDHLNFAGLGDKTLHSTRGSMASSFLINKMPMDPGGTQNRVAHCFHFCKKLYEAA